MIDIKVVQDAYEHSEVQTNGFIRSANNHAEDLTKVKRCTMLDQISADSQLSHFIE